MPLCVKPCCGRVLLVPYRYINARQDVRTPPPAAEVILVVFLLRFVALFLVPHATKQLCRGGLHSTLGYIMLYRSAKPLLGHVFVTPHVTKLSRRCDQAVALDCMIFAVAHSCAHGVLLSMPHVTRLSRVGVRCAPGRS